MPGKDLLHSPNDGSRSSLENIDFSLVQDPMMTVSYDAYTAFELDRPMERVLRVTFNRPERLNALDEEGHRQFCDIWRDIGRDSSVNAVILRGKGRAFSAGGDFTMIEKNISDTTYRRSEEHTSELQSLMRNSYAVFC